jgi:hypothetical protein
VSIRAVDRPIAKLQSIIAVHGIGANPSTTWSIDGVNWLENETMLPSAVPNARIMRFSYESRWFGEHAVKQRLTAVAERLLRSLSWERKVNNKKAELINVKSIRIAQTVH